MQGDQITSSIKGNKEGIDVPNPPPLEQVYDLNLRADQNASCVKENQQITDGLPASDGVEPPEQVHEVNMQPDQTKSSVNKNEEVIDGHLVEAVDGVKDDPWCGITDEDFANIKMSQVVLPRPWDISDEEVAKIKMSQIGLPRPLVMEVEEKDVTPEKLAQKKFPGKLAPDPYVGDFDSGTSKCIFDIKHPFMSDIDEFYPLSDLAQEFVEFVEDGMNMTRRPKTLYRDGKNDLPKDFVFDSCHINKKDRFEALAHSGRPLKDTILPIFLS
ncbi:uncharacterized protein LOC132046123 isoform X2 [Lycium ferocissimum]|uniref:uncharacterized protein LOC132046123 isoform X2 n=1 Tax=Lycium ferocissimum TaxID=112874 RepID=UPI002816907C|nr:uncharacterized protein LOC132046123 isoform X2 [Lycium ferocissimum]